MNPKVSALISLKNRFPDKQNTFKLFVAVVFPIHIWAIVVTLKQVPTYLLHLQISEIIGILAYTLAFILLECISITILFILVGVVLPEKLFKSQIVAHAALLVPLALIIAYLIQIFDYIFFVSEQVYLANLIWLEIWISALMMFLIIGYFIRKFQKLSELLMKYVDRITILSLIYIFIDIIAIFIITWRNILVSS